MNETLTPVPVEFPGALVPAQPPHQRLLSAFLAGRSPRTLRADSQDLADFTTWSGARSPEEAARLLLAAGQGAANEAVLRYRAHLLERDLAPATVNRRLAALRSLVKLARTLGFCGWTLEVEGVRSEAYRDTRGPGTEGYRKLQSHLVGLTDAKGLRDRTLLQLLYNLGLRRAEVVGLDVEDLDLAGSTVAVLGKGKRERVKLTLPQRTQEALAAWLQVRGLEPGPLFVALDRAHRGHRQTGSAVYQMVRSLGELVGVRARAHGLRHSALTRALDLTGGNIREVQQFSRHRSVQTVLKYDDNRRNTAGELARRLAED